MPGGMGGMGQEQWGNCLQFALLEHAITFGSSEYSSLHESAPYRKAVASAILDKFNTMVEDVEERSGPHICVRPEDTQYDPRTQTLITKYDIPQYSDPCDDSLVKLCAVDDVEVPELVGEALRRRAAVVRHGLGDAAGRDAEAVAVRAARAWKEDFRPSAFSFAGPSASIKHEAPSMKHQASLKGAP